MRFRILEGISVSADLTTVLTGKSRDVLFAKLWNPAILRRAAMTVI